MTLGEWVESNIVGIVVAVVGWLTSVAAFIWYLSGQATTSKQNGEKLDKLSIAFDRHMDDFDDHAKDPNVHTTFEQRQAINARFDRLETSIERGHSTIEAKIDRWAERILNK